MLQTWRILQVHTEGTYCTFAIWNGVKFIPGLRKSQQDDFFFKVGVVLITFCDITTLLNPFPLVTLGVGQVMVEGTCNVYLARPILEPVVIVATIVSMCHQGHGWTRSSVGNLVQSFDSGLQKPVPPAKIFFFNIQHSSLSLWLRYGEIGPSPSLTIYMFPLGVASSLP